MWGTLLSTALKQYGPTIASAASSLAAGKSAGRAATNDHSVVTDNQSLVAQGQEENSAQNRAKLEMDQKEAQRDALNDAYKNAMRSSLAMNLQDSTSVRPAGVPAGGRMTGGLRPSALGTQGKEAAAAMNNSAMQSLLNPDSLTTLAPQKHFRATPMQEAGAMENIMGTAGMVGNGIQQYKAQQQEAENNSLVQRLMATLRDQKSSGIGASDIPTGNPTA